MPRILNLDEMPAVAVETSIVYKGETHVFQPLTLEQFVETARRAEKMVNSSEEQTTSESVQGIKESIGQAFPTLSPHLPGMSFSHVMSIFEFMSITTDAVVEKTAVELGKDAVGNEAEPQTTTT